MMGETLHELTTVGLPLSSILLLLVLGVVSLAPIALQKQIKQRMHVD